jgi:type IV pilus modification protein PilV
MKYFSISKNNKGFTLIEVLIAVVILTIGLLALVSVAVMVIKGNSLNKMRTTATTLANEQFETLKNTNYDGIASSASWSTVTGFPGYERRWTVTTSGFQKTIVMDVRWLWLGIYRQVTLNTIISK